MRMKTFKMLYEVQTVLNYPNKRFDTRDEAQTYIRECVDGIEAHGVFFDIVEIPPIQQIREQYR